MICVDRLLGVIPGSNTSNRLATFAVVEALASTVIAPAHGGVTHLATARADTKAYLVSLRAHMKKVVDEGMDMSTAVRSFDAAPLVRLRNRRVTIATVA